MGRIEDLKKKIDKEGLEAFLITRKENLYYFLNFIGEGTLLITKDKAILFVTPLFLESAEEQCKNIEILKLSLHIDPLKYIINEIKKINGKIGFDELSSKSYIYFSSNLSKDNKLLNKEEIIWDMRKIKDEDEILKIKEAAKITDMGLKLALEIIKPGITELDIKAEVIKEMMKNGAEEIAFEPIIASGRNSSFPHGGYRNRKLKKGDIVVIDIGAKYKGYCSDETRVSYVYELDNEMKKVYNIVLEAQELALKNIKEGIAMKEVDKKVRDFFKEKGFKDKFIHGLGHGIGINIHEPPTINPLSKDFFKKNMVVSCEPGIYIPKNYGIRIEDTILIKEKGVEILTKTSKDIEL
ncbi:MAG: Xaa-Pro peptidase family protein [Nitrososphaerota archaeon]